MKISTYIRNLFNRPAPRRRARGRTFKRSYDAGRRDRLTGDFTDVVTSANFELRRSLRVMRARSRNLARNNDYVKNFLRMCRDNISGPSGIKVQARALRPDGEPDETLNRRVEAAWREWCHKGTASASGKLSFRDIERKLDTHLARDGEVLVRVVYPEGNKFGIALRIYSVDWLDETYNERRPDGNRVIMSVEVDADDRPVAYWLTPPPADYQFLDTNQQGRYRTRVDAAEIIHYYLPDDENSDDDAQTRGVPWTHTALRRLKMHGGYEEAEVVAARIAASKMAFFQETEPDEESYDGDEDEDKESRGGELMDAPEPGTFGIIPEGYELKEWNPEHPNTNYGAFNSAVLRGAAAGLGVPYFALTHDLASVNYSSARIGLLDARDVWRGLQLFKVEHFNLVVWLLWLGEQLLQGRVNSKEFMRLGEPAFHGRGWTWIDPLKEAAGTVTAINNGFDTITATLAEQGRDLDEYIQERKRELRKFADAGIPLAAPDQGAPQVPPDEEDDGEQTPLKK